MTEPICTVKVWSFENGDVIARFYSNAGSSPVVICDEGTMRSAEQIGEDLLEVLQWRCPAVEWHPGQSGL